jgi:hypothetical protein
MSDLDMSIRRLKDDAFRIDPLISVRSKFFVPKSGLPEDRPATTLSIAAWPPTEQAVGQLAEAS